MNKYPVKTDDRIAAIWILRQGGEALLQHRDDKPGLQDAGMWVPPGGHAERCETMADCARRELREETEYNDDALHFLMSRERTSEDGITSQISYFWCLYDEIQSIVCHEGQALAFIQRSAAPNYSMPLHLLQMWDMAIAASNEIKEKGN